MKRKRSGGSENTHNNSNNSNQGSQFQQNRGHQSTVAQNTINLKLPPELLELVFKNLHEQSLWSAGQVSKHWRNIIVGTMIPRAVSHLNKFVTASSTVSKSLEWSHSDFNQLSVKEAASFEKAVNNVFNDLMSGDGRIALRKAEYSKIDTLINTLDFACRKLRSLDTKGEITLDQLNLLSKVKNLSEQLKNQMNFLNFKLEDPGSGSIYPKPPPFFPRGSFDPPK